MFCGQCFRLEALFIRRKAMKVLSLSRRHITVTLCFRWTWFWAEKQLKLYAYVWLIHQSESPVWRERLNPLVIYCTSWFILTEKLLWMGFTDKIFIDWPVSCFSCVGFVRYRMNVEGSHCGCLESNDYWMKARLVLCLCGWVQ